MLIGGLQKTSLLDYPNKVSSIIFTTGCNFRCGFCYNPELVTQIVKKNLISEQQIFNFLNKRKKILDAVVITGGEPTMHKDLPRFIAAIKEIGFLVKLDTNGTNPLMLKKLIKQGLIDYIAMDIKAPLRKYSKVVNIKIDTKLIKNSIKAIMNSGLGYEFRSTVLPALHTKEDLVAMSKMISGAKRYFLQKFVPSAKMIDPQFRQLRGFSDKEMKQLALACKQHVDKVQVRG